MEKTNIHIVGAPGREEREKGIKKCISGNYDWKLPKPEKGNRYPCTRSTEGPKQNEPNWPKPGHSIIKMANIEDNKRILKAAGEKQRVRY